MRFVGVFLDLEFWVIRGVRDFGRKSLYFFRTISVRDFYFLFFPRGFVEGFELLICCGVRDSWFLLCTAQLSESERARERERERAWILRVKREGGGQKRGSHVLSHLFGAEHAAAPTTLRAASP